MYTDNVVYFPLKDEDINAASFVSHIDLTPNRMVMDVTNDKLDQMTLSSNQFQKGAQFLSRLLHLDKSGFVYTGTTSNYSDPFLYPTYNESDFMIDDPTFMKRFTKESPYYLSLPSKPNCNLDLSNILPPEFLKNSVDLPLPTSDAETAIRIPQVDAELIEREEWGKNLLSYELMRNVAMNEMDGIYASDHIELRHAKTMYRSIRELEVKVVNELSKRMESTNCYTTTFNRYNEMTKELILERKEEWNLIRDELIESNKKLRKPREITNEVVNEAFSRIQSERKKKRSGIYYNTDYFSSPTNQFCDGCEIVRIRGKPMYKKAVFSSRKYPNGVSLRKWIGNEEVRVISTVEKPWYPNATTPFGVTGIVAASWDRMFELKQMLTRWKGPLSIIFVCTSRNERHAVGYISKHFFPERLTLLLYSLKPEHPHYSSFPINFLRNLAIVNIRTTHFMVLDMDLRVTFNTYDEINRIPDFLKKSDCTAVILPIFFFNHTSILRRCTSVESCAFLSNYYQPETKTDLVTCIHTLNCYSNKQLIRTHMYIMPEWYITRESSAVSRIRCFITDFMEPYVMVRYSRKLPLFDERFINYGYNKVQYFENLRQMGYVFYILNHAFAMDFPHPETEFRKTYSTMIHSNIDNPMKLLYNDVQKEYSARYAHVKNSRVCYLRQKGYYEVI